MLKYLLEKEFKQFRRNKFLPRLVVMFPLMVLLVFPLVANFEIKNINLSILDYDKSTYSRQLIQKVQSSGYFRLRHISAKYSASLNEIEQGDADVILEIPLGFEGV